MTPKRILYGILSSIILLEILSITTVGSPWPWAILFYESLGLKILGWYLVIQSCLGLIFLPIMKLLWGGRKCPICNKDLETFIPVFGKPVFCYRCRTWFHKNCFMSKKNRCPICYPESTEGPDIPLDFTTGLPRTPSEFDE